MVNDVKNQNSTKVFNCIYSLPSPPSSFCQSFHTLPLSQTQSFAVEKVKQKRRKEAKSAEEKTFITFSPRYTAVNVRVSIVGILASFLRMHLISPNHWNCLRGKYLVEAVSPPHPAHSQDPLSLELFSLPPLAPHTSLDQMASW